MLLLLGTRQVRVWGSMQRVATVFSALVCVCKEADRVQHRHRGTVLGSAVSVSLNTFPPVLTPAAVLVAAAGAGGAVVPAAGVFVATVVGLWRRADFLAS